MSKLTVEIVTPERVVYSGEAKMVIVRGVQGELGILPQHTPIVTPLKIAPVRILLEDGKETKIAVSGGFMEVSNNKVTILAEAAELPGDIDRARAEEAKKRAEKRISEKFPDFDIQRAECALQRATMRLDISQKQLTKIPGIKHAWGFFVGSWKITTQFVYNIANAFYGS